MFVLVSIALCFCLILFLSSYIMFAVGFLFFLLSFDRIFFLRFLFCAPFQYYFKLSRTATATSSLLEYIHPIYMIPEWEQNIANIFEFKIFTCTFYFFAEQQHTKNDDICNGALFYIDIGYGVCGFEFFFIVYLPHFSFPLYTYLNSDKKKDPMKSLNYTNINNTNDKQHDCAQCIFIVDFCVVWWK